MTMVNMAGNDGALVLTIAQQPLSHAQLLLSRFLQ